MFIPSYHNSSNSPSDSKYNYDLHMHSFFSDGNNSLEDMADACVEQGITHMAFTDHLDARGYFITYRGVHEDPRHIRKYLADISALRTGYQQKIMIYPGVEISTDYEFQPTLSPTPLAKHLPYFSLILIEGWLIDDPLQTALEIRRLADSVGCKDLPVAMAHPEYNSIQASEFQDLVKHNIGFELNGAKFYPSQAEILERLINSCAPALRSRIRLYLGSDAHDYLRAGTTSVVRSIVFDKGWEAMLSLPKDPIDFWGS